MDLLLAAYGSPAELVPQELYKWGKWGVVSSVLRGGTVSRFDMMVPYTFPAHGWNF